MKNFKNPQNIKRENQIKFFMKLFNVLMLVLFFSFLVNVVNAQEEPVCIVYFYGLGCSHCAEVSPFLHDLEDKYGDKIDIHKLEIYHNLENYQKYNGFCGVNDLALEKRGVPLVVISDKFFMGVSPIKNNLENEIDLMLETGERVCPLDGQMECHSGGSDDASPMIEDYNKKITLPLILVTGLIDGINPCAFAVLLFLLMFLLGVSNNRKRMLKAGLAYVVAVYVTYFLAGLGLLAVIQMSGASNIIVKVAAVLAIIFGLVNIKDYFWYGKGFSLKIPESKKSIIENLTRKANIPAAIALGFLVSMFELPCTGGVYLAIIALLANTMTRLSAIGYLLVYNVMFILPLIVIIFLVLKGLKAEHIEKWRESKKNIMKLVLGLLLLVLGVLMLVGII